MEEKEKSAEGRKAISKKMRFDVFKRDGFRCQYCGSTPPAVVLEADHIHPVSAGGKNRMDNLITACFDCNRGKGAGLLSSVPESLESRADLLREKAAQVKAYTKLVRDIERQSDELVLRVQSVFQRYFPTRAFTTQFIDSIKVNFAPAMGKDQLLFAMTKACVKIQNDPSAATKYFCGICWNMIKGKK